MASLENRRVLFVDDEKGVLDGLARLLHADFEVTTVESGLRALGCLRRVSEPFAVIVSDERMPVLSGAAFLARARQVAPNSVRMLLTGQADMNAAIAAVNEGHIFRFLSKPCPPATLRAALEAGIAQHQLLIAEQELLERTLTAVVKTLVDVLSLAAPELFNRASVVKQYVGHVVKTLGMSGGWQAEVAASLHTLGLIALPSDLARLAVGGATLTSEQKQQVATHPEMGQKILAAIPRLEDVAAIVGQQLSDSPTGSDLVVSSAKLLRVAIKLEERVARGMSLRDALKWVATITGDMERPYLEALRSFEAHTERMAARELRAKDLSPHMLLVDDVTTRDGALIVSRGRELNTVLIERLRQFSLTRSLREPIRVLVPTVTGDGAAPQDPAPADSA